MTWLEREAGELPQVLKASTGREDRSFRKTGLTIAREWPRRRSSLTRSVLVFVLAPAQQEGISE